MLNLFCWFDIVIGCFVVKRGLNILEFFDINVFIKDEDGIKDVEVKWVKFI